MLAGKPFLLCIGPNWEITVSTTNTSRPVVIVTRRSWLWVLVFCACSWDGCIPAYTLGCLGCLLGPNLQGLYTHTVPTGKLYCMNSPCWYIPLFENIVHLFTEVLDIFSASSNTLRFWAGDGWCLWTWSGVLPPIPQISDCGPWVFWREWACSHCTKLSGGCWLPPRDHACLCNSLN